MNLNISTGWPEIYVYKVVFYDAKQRVAQIKKKDHNDIMTLIFWIGGLVITLQEVLKMNSIPAAVSK